MYRIVIVVAILVCTVSIVFGQNKTIDVGLFVSANLSTQINKNPEIPEDGRFQWNNRLGWSGGLVLSMELRKYLFLETRFSYQEKGYTELAQTSSIGIPGSFKEQQLENKFNYFSIDLLSRWRITQKDNYPFVFIGLRCDFLLHTDLGSDIYPLNLFYPVSEYGDFKKFSGGWIFGAGLSIDDRIIIRAETNYDIIPVLTKDNLTIKNWVWSVGIAYNLFRRIKIE